MFRACMAIGLLLVLCGCSSVHEWRSDRQLEHAHAAARAKIDEPACRAAGGQVRGVGMFATPACVVPYADAGKACRDKSDCQGRCIVMETRVAEGTPIAGTCQPNDQLFGCWVEVVEGRVHGGMCVD